MFQMMMNELFMDMEDVVIVYIDNIMIFTKGSLAEHQAKVKEVLQRLRDNDLFACLEKCSFDKTEVKYLRMFVNCDGICMDNTKVKAITEWPAPMTVCSICSFLSLANFYHCFIKDYAILTKLLMDLTQKDKVFTWGKAEASTVTCYSTRTRPYLFHYPFVSTSFGFPIYVYCFNYVLHRCLSLRNMVNLFFTIVFHPFFL